MSAYRRGDFFVSVLRIFVAMLTAKWRRGELGLGDASLFLFVARPTLNQNVLILVHVFCTYF